MTTANTLHTDLRNALVETGLNSSKASTVAGAMLERLGTPSNTSTTAYGSQFKSNPWRNVKRIITAAALLNGLAVTDAIKKGNSVRNWARDEGSKPAPVVPVVPQPTTALGTNEIVGVLKAAGISQQKRDAITLILG